MLPVNKRTQKTANSGTNNGEGQDRAGRASGSPADNAGSSPVERGATPKLTQGLAANRALPVRPGAHGRAAIIGADLAARPESVRPQVNLPEKGRLFAHSLTEDEVTQFIPSAEPSQRDSRRDGAPVKKTAFGLGDDDPATRIFDTQRLASGAKRKTKATLLRPAPRGHADSGERPTLLDEEEASEFAGREFGDRGGLASGNGVAGVGLGDSRDGFAAGAFGPGALGAADSDSQMPAALPVPASALSRPRASVQPPAMGAAFGAEVDIGLSVQRTAPLTFPAPHAPPTHPSRRDGLRSQAIGTVSAAGAANLVGAPVATPAHFAVAHAADVRLDGTSVTASRLGAREPRAMAFWGVTAAAVVVLVAGGVFASSRNLGAAATASAFLDPSVGAASRQTTDVQNTSMQNAENSSTASSVPVAPSAMGVVELAAAAALGAVAPGSAVPVLPALSASAPSSASALAAASAGAAATAAASAKPKAHAWSGPVATHAGTTLTSGNTGSAAQTGALAPLDSVPMTAVRPVATAKAVKAPPTDAEKKAADDAKRMADKQLGDPML